MSKSHSVSNDVHNRFSTFAGWVSNLLGNVWVCLLASSLIILWVLIGFLVNFSEGWQLIFNTATTIITFIMVFIIQNTQNRDSAIVNLKLAELIRATASARNSVIDLQSLTDDELKILEQSYRKICRKKEECIK